MSRAQRFNTVASRAIGIALAVMTSSAARADTPPSPWDAAKDPHVRERYELHARVCELMIVADRTERGFVALKTLAYERARALLEEGNAASSPDVRLRFDLGEVYYELEHLERAIAVLQPAVDAYPDHPAAIAALESLAFAYAKLDRTKEEREVYKRFLARVNDDGSRAQAMLNLAEADMHLGVLQDAVDGYRDAIRTSGNMPNSRNAAVNETLAVWGLAVALDRAGDPQASLEQTRLATQLDLGEQLIAHDPVVFFVPEYERDWYLGLAEAVHAREATSARAAAAAWARAEQHWDHYVTSADAADRFVALARQHLARTHAQRVAADARAAKEPLPAPNAAVSPTVP